MNSFTKIILLFGICSCSPSVHYPDTYNSSPDSTSIESSQSNLMIIAIDVGQGDSTLVITPSQKVLLIDAGPVESGTNVILPLLTNLGIHHIDYFLPSQYDADHIGGYAEVVAGNDAELGTEDDLFPEITYDRGGTKADAGEIYESYLATIGDTRRTINPGQTIDLEEGVTIFCPMANGQGANGSSVELDDADENGHSVSLLLTYGAFRYLTAGDLSGGGMDTVDLETTLGELIGDVDILHINHHGSQSSSNKNYLESTTPEVAIISMGNENTYGHPHPDILNRLSDLGIDVFQTEMGNGGYLPSAHIAEDSIYIYVNEYGSYLVNGYEY